MGTRRHRILIGSALVALVLTMMVGQAQAIPPTTGTALAQAADRAVDKEGNGLAACNGGVQEASFVRMNDLPTNLVENGAFAPLPGAAISFVTPANDSDQIKVTFSAEARLLGQPLTYVVPVDFLQVRILLDGVPMAPLNDLSFTTDVGQANATQACQRVPASAVATAHTVRVEWLLVDQGMNHNLGGNLDDWLLDVEVGN